MSACPRRLVPKEERPRQGFFGDGCVCRSQPRAAELAKAAGVS